MCTEAQHKLSDRTRPRFHLRSKCVAAIGERRREKRSNLGLPLGQCSVNGACLAGAHVTILHAALQEAHYRATCALT